MIKKIPLVVILVSLIATAQYSFLSTYFANFVEYKANLISELISKEDQVIDSENFFSAEKFCEVWTGKAIDLVDCGTGRDIKNFKYLISDSQKDVYKKALIYAVTKKKN